MHVLDDVPVKKMKREQGGVEQKRVNLIEKKKVGSKLVHMSDGDCFHLHH